MTKRKADQTRRVNTDYSRRITSIAEQIGVLYADMYDEEVDGSPEDITECFVRNLEDAVEEIDGALDELRRQIILEKGDDHE